MGSKTGVSFESRPPWPDAASPTFLSAVDDSSDACLIPVASPLNWTVKSRLFATTARPFLGEPVQGQLPGVHDIGSVVAQRRIERIATIAAPFAELLGRRPATATEFRAEEQVAGSRSAASDPARRGDGLRSAGLDRRVTVPARHDRTRDERGRASIGLHRVHQ